MLRNYLNIDNMSSIHNFKQGDIITRTEPSGRGDRSYMGDKLRFVGIVNSHLCYDRLEPSWDSGGIRTLALDDWSEGWELYIDPITLMTKKTITGERIF